MHAQKYRQAQNELIVICSPHRVDCRIACILASRLIDFNALLVAPA
jgi:hypothetical protein